MKNLQTDYQILKFCCRQLQNFCHSVPCSLMTSSHIHCLISAYLILKCNFLKSLAIDKRLQYNPSVILLYSNCSFFFLVFFFFKFINENIHLFIFYNLYDICNKHLKLFFLFLVFASKLLDDELVGNIVADSALDKNIKILHFTGNYDILKHHHKGTSDSSSVTDKLIPEHNKVIFVSISINFITTYCMC